MPGPFVLSYVMLWALVAFQGVILIGLTVAVYELRQGSDAAERRMVRGRRAPNFTAIDLTGNQVSMASITGEATALLFVSPNCPSCSVSLAELSPLVSDSGRRLVIVCRGEDESCRQLAADYGLNLPVVADGDGDLMRLFGVAATPMAVRISAKGIIESYGEPVRGEDLEELVAGTAAVDEPTSQARGSEQAVGDEYSNI